MTAHAIITSDQLGTAETYLNPQRAQGFAQALSPGTHAYSLVPEKQLHLNEFSLGDIFLAVGFAALTIPTLVSLANQSWSREFGAYGPIVLADGSIYSPDGRQLVAPEQGIA